MRFKKIEEFGGGATQNHFFAAWQQEARASLDSSANALAALTGSETIDPARRQRGTEELSPNRTIDLGSMAVVSEAVVILAARLEAAERELAQVRGELAAAGKG